MKTCIICLTEKPLSDFYKHKEMADGYLGRCKDCHKLAMKKRRIEKLEAIREYDRNRPNKKERAEKNKEYQKLNRELVNTTKRQWIMSNQPKRKAHILVGNAIRSGDIVRPKHCQVCNEECKPEAHHYDYSRALDVVWLCKNCHVDIHKKERELQRIAHFQPEIKVGE